MRYLRRAGGAGSHEKWSSDACTSSERPGRRPRPRRPLPEAHRRGLRFPRDAQAPREPRSNHARHALSGGRLEREQSVPSSVFQDGNTSSIPTISSTYVDGHSL